MLLPYLSPLVIILVILNSAVGVIHWNLERYAGYRGQKGA